MKQNFSQSRIRIVSGIVLCLACVLVLKLFFLQVVHSSTYTNLADKQYATPSGDVFNRGTIYFTDKNNSLVAAASVTTGFKVAIKTSAVEDVEALYKDLQPYTSFDHDTFIAHATKKNDPYEEVAVHLTSEQASAIEALKLPGVSVYKDNWRFYPGGTLAAQEIGFLAYNKDNDKVGQYGLERFYNDVLAKSKNEAYVNVFAEVFSNIRDSLAATTVQGDLVTTIEPSVQHVLEQELADTMKKWNADGAGGIIINPNNGEIYAMASVPTFDLNDFRTSTPEVYKNQNVESVFEFGSVIKPLVMSAALDVGAVTPETTYNDLGSVTVNKKVINNFDKKGRGMVNMQTVLDQSLNTGMVFVENKLGNDRFRTYMKAYGIGQKTGIDLPSETSGLIKNLESPRDIEYANASFGQGIALTPVEAVRAFSSITNGGYLVTPHIGTEVKYEDGLSKTLEFPKGTTPLIKKETSDTITRMLVHVFEAYDGGAHKMDHYSIASKTGTAQIAQAGGKGYYLDRHTHSFFGYFPAYDPKFLVFIYLKNPKQVKYASQTLIPPFIDITKFILNYYNVPPDR
jgi:cell division protein FtsI/penicillin-binding protein 2